MKYAFISDIHGNLAALEQVFKLVEILECDKIICLGDIVGYGPFPNACIKAIRRRADQIVIGNHDSAAIIKTPMTYFNKYAKEAIYWTRRELSDENKTWLESLDFVHLEYRFRAVHATPHSPEKWDYILTLPDAFFNFVRFPEKICFIGHSHVPVVFKYHDETEDVTMEPGPAVGLLDDSRYIINVGSVGQPRDRDPRASFGVYDDNLQVFRLYRTEYNIAATQSAMQERGLPGFLIQRLESGE